MGGERRPGYTSPTHPRTSGSRQEGDHWSQTHRQRVSLPKVVDAKPPTRTRPLGPIHSLRTPSGLFHPKPSGYQPVLPESRFQSQGESPVGVKRGSTGFYVGSPSDSRSGSGEGTGRMGVRNAVVGDTTHWEEVGGKENRR